MSDHPSTGPSVQGGGELPPACAAVDEDLAELALGTLSGRQRMLALAHLEGCQRCSTLVEELSGVADQLLQLAPAAEPPVGFEARVFERLGLMRQRGPHTSRRSQVRATWRTSSLLAAAAVAVVLAFGLGALVGHSQGTGADHYNQAAPIELSSLVSHGHDMGSVYVYAGNPTWLFMVIDGSHWQGTLRCEVTVDDGPPQVLGQFWLSDGKGAWAESISQPAGRLRQARVLSASGQVLATADLDVS